MVFRISELERSLKSCRILAIRRDTSVLPVPDDRGRQASLEASLEAIREATRGHH